MCTNKGCVLCRRAIPLALALLNVSNPILGAMDGLSRLSHDTDAEVAQNAVVALGVPPKHLNATLTFKQLCLRTIDTSVLEAEITRPLQT